MFRSGVAGMALFVGTILTPSLAVPAGTGASAPGPVPSLQDQNLDLAGILERCALYCERLSSAVLDFVCTERVEETVAPIVPSGAAVAVGGSSGPVFLTRGGLVAGRKKRAVYIYDYQLVHDKLGEITETRTLAVDNGRKVEEKNAPLKTQVFHYRYVVMGPIGLLARDRQAGFDYSVVDETSFKKERVVIIRASPKPGSLGEFLYGKIWVRQKDAEILRIEWQPESMGNYDQIEDLAKKLQMTPRLSFVSEYGFEKNGIRFPSRYTIEEAYTSKTWRPVIRSKTEVTYEAYKFFTVETGVSIK